MQNQLHLVHLPRHHQFLVIFIFLQLHLHCPDFSCFCTGSQIVHRPSPSHDITSLIHLQEIPGSRYDPRTINHAKLKLKLGRHYDPEFMSIYPPVDLNMTVISSKSIPNNRSNNNPTHKRNLKKHRHQQQKHQKDGSKNKNINDVLGTSNLIDYTSIPEKFHGRLRFKFIRKLEKFLQVYTACPVVHKWKDLGIRFWPRYLREGNCQGELADGSTIGVRSCSIPPGLYCQPSQQIYKVLLRWHCQNWEYRKRCRWLEIRYPIITACSCGTCVNQDRQQ